MKNIFVEAEEARRAEAWKGYRPITSTTGTMSGTMMWLDEPPPTHITQEKLKYAGPVTAKQKRERAMEQRAESEERVKALAERMSLRASGRGGSS